MHVEDILREIDAALERRGISARAASIRAQGAPEMIRDMRRGHVPSVERLRSLCEVLGLEFYVGPPRWRRAEDGGALPDVPLRSLERSARDLVRLTLDAGGDPIPEDLWPVLLARRGNEARAAREDPPDTGPNVDVVDFDTGRRPETGDPGRRPVGGRAGEPSPEDAAATPAAEPLDTLTPFLNAEDRRDLSVFHDKHRKRRLGGGENLDWLAARGLDPVRWTLVPIPDESMEPTLPKGCLAVVDSTKTDPDSTNIKVVKFGDHMLLRRAATDEAGRRRMVCDHPDWPDEPWPSGARIVGEIKWMGRELG